MPIYEYYCACCHGRFSYLAKSINAATPACPRCGNVDVERLISAARVLHNTAHHAAQLQADRQRIDTDDPQVVAQFLKDSGRLTDSDGLYGSQVYRELLDRRAAGASEADVADLTNALVAEVHSDEITQMSGAVMFSEQVENRMQAEGPPERHDHESPLPLAATSRRGAQNLGWVSSDTKK
ncbi:MAG TPA: zinc ribbon domain-containing protein [Anaerolineae bacterium]|nr:zinc ribbon domain-containing protein [Anaerolineae bacterium]